MPSTINPNLIDRNANTPNRHRRNWQRASQGALTKTIKTVAPLTTSATGLGLSFATATGLGLVGNALSILFADGTITGSAAGIKVGTIAESQVTNLVADLASKVPSTRAINTTAPLSGGGNLSADRTLSIAQVTSTTNGYLTSTDWTTFNNKQPAGSYAVTSRAINTTAPLSGGGDLSADRTLSLPVATSAANGYLSSTDWTTFNGKSNTTGTVTSVGLSLPGVFIVSGSPVTGAGTLTANLANQGSTQVFVGPASGVSAPPTFRVLTATDLPNLPESQITNLVTDLAAKVPTTRTLTTTAPLAGGGDLSANRTLSIPVATSTANGYVSSTDWASFNQATRTLFTFGNGANTVTQTTLTSFGQTFPLGANTLTVGKQIRITAFGAYTAVNNAQQGTIVGVINPGAVGDGFNITSPLGSGRWFLQITIHVVTAGVGGTVNVGGYAYFANTTGVITVVEGQLALAFDTTIARTLDVMGLWSVANASNVLSLRGGCFEELSNF